MGDCQNRDLRVQFDRRLKLKFLGSKVTTDAGLLAYRELDEAFHLTEMADDAVEDSRVGKNKEHGIVPLLRQSIYSRLAGYEDVNDAERLSIDPAMRHVVGGRASQQDQQAASSSEIGRFETEILSTKSNLKKLIDLPGNWIDRVHQRQPPKEPDPRPGQLGERDIWRAGRLGVQRPFRLHVLSSPVYLQPVRRLGTCHAAAR